MSQQAPAAPAKQIKWFSMMSLFSFLVGVLLFIGGVIFAATAGFTTATTLLLIAAGWTLGQSILFAIYGTQE